MKMLKIFRNRPRNMLLQWSATYLIFGCVLYLPRNFDFNKWGNYEAVLDNGFNPLQDALPLTSIAISNLICMLTLQWFIRAFRNRFPYFEPYQHIPIIAHLCGEYFNDYSVSLQIKAWVILAVTYFYYLNLTQALYNLFQSKLLPCPVKFCGEHVPEWPKPLIFPSRTTHARFFPKKHSFSYSYLMVGVPIGWQGVSSSMISTDRHVERAWFHVDGKDHLFRAEQGTSGELKSKLHAYLRSESHDPNDYPYAYLVTAPRIFGYCFNPVSFWYLYSAEKELNAMILEVNNTFDERRMYLLKKADGDNIGNEEEKSESGQLQFFGRWKKDFHVSPFNSRKGTYVLRAKDPLRTKGDATCQISNTVNLLSSQDHKKLVASIYSTGPSLNPEELSWFGKWKTLAVWAWVGFLTFPRILREAWRLFFAHKLHVWFRPEVLKGSIGRQASESEIDLELCFRQFLADVVTNSKMTLKLQYMPPRGMGAMHKYEFISTHINSSSVEEQDGVTLEALSPAFYSRLVHYAHVSEAIDGEFRCTEIRNRTVTISRPDALIGAFREYEAAMIARRECSINSFLSSENGIGFLERSAWELVRRLRCPPAQQSYPSSSTAAAAAAASSSPARLHSPGQGQGQGQEKKEFITKQQQQHNNDRVGQFSALDLFVITCHDYSSTERAASTTSTLGKDDAFTSSSRSSSSRWVYIYRVIAIFLAQRLTFGFEGPICIFFFIAKLASSYLGVALLRTSRVYLDQHSQELDSIEALRWMLLLGFGLATLLGLGLGLAAVAPISYYTTTFHYTTLPFGEVRSHVQNEKVLTDK